MLRRLFEKKLLCPGDVLPSQEDFEVVGAFNPAAAVFGNEVVLLVRVAERPRLSRSGYTALPRWSPTEGMVIDWIVNEDITFIDPRVVRRNSTGLIRLTFISYLRVIRAGDGRAVSSVDGAVFTPQLEWEEFGVEDPRLTYLDGRYYFSYVAVSRHGAATALASTTDFQNFERHGIIFSPENKDVVLFPERLGGDYAALHRPNAATPFTRPEMWLARSPDLVHWGRHENLYWGTGPWESGRVGAGAPPLRTPAGWLEIYHGNQPGARPGEVGVYSAGAMLLDLDEPARVRSHCKTAILEPTTDFERQGFVPSVFFPTAAIARGDNLLIYYGAADTCTGVVEISQSELLSMLQ
jgi:predicted GH43/DUF377 family glycosyl hydrolase